MIVVGGGSSISIGVVDVVVLHKRLRHFFLKLLYLVCLDQERLLLTVPAKT